MEKNSLYKVFAGRFSMLDAEGNQTNYYKDYSLFRNTYGLAFFIHSATRGRCYVIYFARDDREWNYRTVFPVGNLIEEENKVCIKTRYNTFLWESGDNLETSQIEALYQWVKVNGETYIPGLNRHPGVKEYFDRDCHFK